MKRISEALKNIGILPVINIKNSRMEDTLMVAVEKTPIQCIEVTLRSDYSCEAIQNIKAKYPEMIVGAGTVMNLADYAKARACGADYIVSPGLDAELVMKCMEDGIPVVPGCATPSEIMLAKNLGCNVVKFFPAELSGGIAALKLYESAFQGMLFLPTGGITLENIEGYFRAKNVLACGGSFMANEKLLSEGDNETVTKKCLELIDQYKKTRGE